MSASANLVTNASQLLAAGDVRGAARKGELALRAAADDADVARAHLVLAACARKAGQVGSGLQHAQAAVALIPDDAPAHYLHAELLEAAGDVASAMVSLRRALEINPDFVQAWFYLGVLEGDRGNPAGAASAFQRAVALDPMHARGWNNLGNALRELDRGDEAQDAFQRALQIKPDYALAAANLAYGMRQRGDTLAAENVVRTTLSALGKKPFRPLVVLLAGLLRERRALDESAQYYWNAIQLAPTNSGGEWFHLGWVLAERGDHERARDCFARAFAADPKELRALCGKHLVLPMVCDSTAELQAARQRYSAGVAALQSELAAAAVPLTADEAVDGLRWTNFFLAYQGGNDRDLQRSYANAMAAVIRNRAPRWHAPVLPVRGTSDRVRVGFASAFLHDGTIGRYFESWLTDLPRERFEIFVYKLMPGMDAVAERIRARADVFRMFGGNEARPSRVAPVIRGDRLDLLVYTDLGMDVTSFVLAALRLAPRQLAAWGHPVTTGHATVDAFISCATMEPPQAEAHYTEKLLLLPGIGTRYERPHVPEPAARADVGLPPSGGVLLCPQSLFKIHPANDDLFADILLADADARIVFFAGLHPAITDRFMRRLQRCFTARGLEVRERTIVLPRMHHGDYMQVNLLADAMLDTLHWSGGNTTLDAIAAGLPVVTMWGEYMRGRQSAAMLELLGVPELIAPDKAAYVTLATRLMRDRAWRSEMSARILAGHHRVFDTSEPLDALSALLLAEARTVHGERPCLPDLL